MKTFEEFKQAIGYRESSNRYDIKNRFGYLGRYQFGLPRLADFNLCRRIEGTTGWAADNFEWTPPFTEAMFLSTPALQDLVFTAHVVDLQRRVKKFTSGLVAGAHLKGYGGLTDLLYNGTAGSDALGTSILEYIKRFSDYELS